MTHTARIWLPLLLGAAAAPLVPAAAADVQISSQGPVVSLSVTEEVRSTPDAASFGTGITTKAPTAKEALRQNSQQMKTLIDRIKQLGVADKDIQTSGINLNAQYDYQQGQEPRFTGYEVSNSVTVTVHDIDRLGELLDAVVAGGANNLNGPSFFVDDDSAVKAQAREQAIASAQAQARGYARAAGYADIRLLSISEAVYNGGGGPQPPRPMMRMVAADASSAPVQPGQVGTSVTIAFEFEMVR